MKSFLNRFKKSDETLTFDKVMDEVSPNYRKNQKGITPAQMILALPFVVLAAIVGIQQIGKINTDNKTIATLDALGKIQSAVQALWDGQPTYGSADMEPIIAASGQLDKNLISGTAIKNEFGGDVQVVPNTTGDKYSVVLNGLPQTTCVRLAAADFGTSIFSVVISATQNSTATPSADTCTNSATTKCSVAFTPPEATTACGSANGSSIAFTFY